MSFPFWCSSAVFHRQTSKLASGSWVVVLTLLPKIYLRLLLPLCSSILSSWKRWKILLLDILGGFDSLLLVLLSWGPPGQEVNFFQCEKLAVARDGKTEPDSSASFSCTANSVAPSEYSQCSSGTSIYTDLYPFQRNRPVSLFRVICRWFFPVEGAVFVPVGRGGEEVTCESWQLHPCCCSVLGDAAVLGQNWTGLHASILSASELVWMPPYSRKGLTKIF